MTFIESDLMKYSCLGKVALIGDFNARTCSNVDFVTYDSPLETDDDDIYQTDQNILLRNSQDKVPSCSRGKQLIDMCISARIRIVNVRCIGDSTGLSCHKYAGRSVIDYLITCEENLRRILYFKVNDFQGQLSDHCSLSWAMKCKLVNPDRYSKKKLNVLPSAFEWNNLSIHSFQMALTQNDIKNKINNFLTLNTDSSTDKAVEDVTDILIKTANKSLRLKKRKSKKYSKDKQWFDQDLKTHKNSVFHHFKLLQKYPNIPNVRTAYNISLATYNKLKKKKKRKFKEYTLRKLDEPQAYWKLLNSLKEQKNNPETRFAFLEKRCCKLV